MMQREPTVTSPWDSSAARTFPARPFVVLPGASSETRSPNGRVEDNEGDALALAVELARSFDVWMRTEKGLAESTRRTRMWTVGRFDSWLRVHHRKSLVKATAIHVRGYLAEYPEPATRNRVLSDIRGFYLFARRTGLREGDPTADIDRLREPETLPRPVEDDLLALLYRAGRGVSPRCYTILCLLGYAGLRRAECANLRWMDLDLRSRMLRVVRGKGKKERYVPMPPPLVKALMEWRSVRQRTSEWVFPGQYLIRPIDVRTIWRDVTDASDAAGIHVTPHRLRHTYGTEMYRDSKDPYGVAKVMGHSNIATTMRYALVVAEDMRSSSDGLDYES